MLVVLYHLSILGFQGGYIGVDIFFVISGYLIIKKILESLINAEINFLDPYKYLFDTDYCFNEIDEKFIYYDNSHLTKFGSMVVLENSIVLEESWLDNKFNWAF